MKIGKNVLHQLFFFSFFPNDDEVSYSKPINKTKFSYDPSTTTLKKKYIKRKIEPYVI